MSKRIIAVICLLALVLGFVPGVATKVNAAENQYVVGYSKKNINPIIQNATTGSLGIPAQYKDSGTLKDYTDYAENVIQVEVHTGTDSETTAMIPMVKIPLRGYGGEDRVAKFLTDDNGDGLIKADEAVKAGSRLAQGNQHTLPQDLPEAKIGMGLHINLLYSIVLIILQ